MMGSGFVEALRRRGDEVVVWNRTFEKAQALERFGARAVRDPREAAEGAEIAHIILSDDAAVDALLEQLDGAFAPQTVVVDHTTVAPGPTVARFARAKERGLKFLHAPVFMSPQGCRDGQGVMLVSGPQALFEEVKPALAPMVSDLWYVGERPDKAAALKLCGNQLIIFIAAGLADIYAMADGLGISGPEAHELFSHFQPTAVVNVRGKKMANADFEPAFELTMARKDARLMLETAAEGGATLRVLPRIVERIDELIARGHGSNDVGVLAVDSFSRRR
jgi:3-hydroxyisobutyrate dehydrogenase